MSEDSDEPTWLDRRIIEQVHREQLQEHGGTFGLRDEARLESSLSRPQSAWHYDDTSDLCRLAALYAHGIVSSHPFVDGNKRTGFLAAFIFLSLNGRTLEADNVDVVVAVRGLASGDLSEEDCADWLREHVSPT